MSDKKWWKMYSDLILGSEYYKQHFQIQSYLKMSGHTSN